MKRLFLLLALVSLVSFNTILAETYKILFINTPTIKIGKSELKVGDTFNDDQLIKWGSPKQAIKVLNTRNNKMRIITAVQAADSKSLKDYFVKTNRMSTRGNGFVDIEEMAQQLSTSFYLLDQVSFDEFLDVDDDHCFVMTYQASGETKEYKLVADGGRVLITRDLFDGVDTTNDITVTIKYIDLTEKTEQVVTDKMVISVIPLEL